MGESRIVFTILLGIVAVITGGIALVLFFQTLSGLGTGGLGLTGAPILAFGGVAVLCVAGIVSLNGKSSETTERDEEP
ncbi:hypothetical protein [Celeribacter litoreus]|uniref:hypothetical protein n=1 Tax=Celeribacter litoreus TaxID=2876714 RepID=UPI001CCC51D1|nr:hypothetical protein [Celeribacter litoreus]MCA0044647.1 hypothetical protein [Celeribacter litoreus]